MEGYDAAKAGVARGTELFQQGMAMTYDVDIPAFLTDRAVEGAEALAKGFKAGAKIGVGAGRFTARKGVEAAAAAVEHAASLTKSVMSKPVMSLDDWKAKCGLEKISHVDWHDEPGRGGIKDLLFEGKQQQLYLKYEPKSGRVGVNILEMLKNIKSNITNIGQPGHILGENWDKSVDSRFRHLLNELNLTPEQINSMSEEVRQRLQDYANNIHQRLVVRIIPTEAMNKAGEGIVAGHVDAKGNLVFNDEIRKTFFGPYGKQLCKYVEVGYQDSQGFDTLATSVIDGEGYFPPVPTKTVESGSQPTPTGIERISGIRQNDWTVPVVPVTRKVYKREGQRKKGEQPRGGKGREGKLRVKLPRSGEIGHRVVPGFEIPKDGRKITDGKGNEIEYKISGPIIDQPRIEIELPKVVGKKAKVVARGQALAGERDLGVEYPVKLAEKTPRQIAEYIISRIDSGQDLAIFDDVWAELKNTPPAQRAAVLERIISNNKIDLHNEKFASARQIVEFVLARVNEEFTALALERKDKKHRSEIPSLDKIHLCNIYEYQAYAAEYGLSGTYGLFFNLEGHVFVNVDALKLLSTSTDDLIAKVKHVLAHEITHATASNTYWEFDDGGDVYYVQRRGGVKQVRREKTGVRERGRALNEAITEEIGRRVWSKIYSQEYMGAGRRFQPIEFYPGEREVLRLLQEKFEIPFEIFSRAAISRKGLAEMVGRLEGNVGKTDAGQGKKRIRPRFVPLLLAIMDYEHNKGRFEYDLTKRFIQEQPVDIMSDMKAFFPPAFLGPDGKVKAEIARQFNLVEAEAGSRAA